MTALSRIPFWGIAVGALFIGTAAAEDSPSPVALLRTFSERWDEGAWIKPFPTSPNGYIRARNNDDWQERMRALRQLAIAGEDAVEPLLKAVKGGDEPVRILAAQALGYLPIRERERQSVRDALLAAAKDDASGAVRLYAVDSLGMLGGNVRSELEPLLDLETNRDVKMHIRYALEREGRAIDPEVCRRLVNWDARQMNSAEPGKLAPDFELPTLTGDRIRLSDHRGKKEVVLVFIYGDT